MKLENMKKKHAERSQSHIVWFCSYASPEQGNLERQKVD